MADTGGLSEADPSFFERMLQILCAYSFAFRLAFVLEFMLLALAVLSAIFADLEPADRVILLVDFLILGFAMAVTLTIIYLCSRYYG